MKPRSLSVSMVIESLMVTVAIAIAQAPLSQLTNSWLESNPAIVQMESQLGIYSHFN